MRTATLNIVFVLALVLVLEKTVCAAEPKSAANVTTLAQEREEIAAEIEIEVLYDPAKQKEAAALLRTMPKDQSPARNVEDALAAFALVDERFAAAAQLLREKKFAEAAEAFEKLVNPGLKSAFTASAAWGKVQALHESAVTVTKAGEVSDEEIKATDAAAAFAQDFYERPSFAIRAHDLALKGYEKEARMIYAYKQYVGYLDAAERLGLTETPDYKRVSERVAQLTKDLKDPVGTVERLMGESRGLLEQSQTGEPTQQKQEEIVSWLDDLIKTQEERASKNQQQQQQKQQARKTGSQQNQQKQGQQQSQPKPSGSQKPSKPAGDSYLAGGDGRTIGQLEEIRPSDRADLWGQLPPAEREKFIQQLKERFPDRYEDILKEYFRELAEDRSPATTQPQ